MSIALAAAYEDLTFMTPLSEVRASRLVSFLSDGLDGGVVLDIGCGWAELLLRVVEAVPSCTGVGIDLDAESIEYGKRVAQERGLADRVSLIEGDGRHMAPQQADAVICVGASQVWNPPSESVEPMGYRRALEAIRAKVERGAHVVYGEGIWSAPPTRAASAPLGGRLDELEFLPDFVEVALGAGFSPLAVHEASLAEWDQFESGCNACYARWLLEHGHDHPDAAEVREMSRRARDGYLRGYRGILGLAYLELVAT
ncbi:MAG: SAM-dependent methyltransferase [Gaiellaceae bacterium]